MARFTTIEICKEFMHFSAAHFTIFSQTERERLHGHNFRVAVRVVAPVDDNGLCFNYKIIKDHIRDLCIELDEYTLLPGNSPYLNIIRENAHYRVEFDGEYMLFWHQRSRASLLVTSQLKSYHTTCYIEYWRTAH